MFIKLNAFANGADAEPTEAEPLLQGYTKLISVANINNIQEMFNMPIIEYGDSDDEFKTRDIIIVWYNDGNFEMFDESYDAVVGALDMAGLIADPNPTAQPLGAVVPFPSRDQLIEHMARKARHRDQVVSDLAKGVINEIKKGDE